MKTLILLFLALSAGCATTYANDVDPIDKAWVEGRPNDALKASDEAIESANDEDGSRTLLRLERATLLQALGDFKKSSTELIEIDSTLEWFDFSGRSTDAMVESIYSAHDAPYQASHVERLMLNNLNMINFLAQGDVSRARVEARRFEIFERYAEKGNEEQLASILALGNYLAGWSFEQSMEWTEASKFYGRAFRWGKKDKEFERQLIDLQRLSGFKRYDEKTRTELASILTQAIAEGALPEEAYIARHLKGHTLIAVQAGIVPRKVATPRDIELQGKTYNVQVPALTAPRGTTDIDLETVGFGDEVWRCDVGTVIQKDWNERYEPIVKAAAMRMAMRNIAADTMDSGAKNAEGTNNGLNVLGSIASAMTKSALANVDRPDTRSWTTLPRVVSLTRVRFTPGAQVIKAKIGKTTDSKRVQIGAASTTINFSKFR